MVVYNMLRRSPSHDLHHDSIHHHTPFVLGAPAWSDKTVEVMVFG